MPLKEKNNVVDTTNVQPGEYVMESVVSPLPSGEKDPIIPESDNAPKYPHGLKLSVVMLALLLSMFLVRHMFDHIFLVSI